MSIDRNYSFDFHIRGFGLDRFALHCRNICTNDNPLSEFKKIVNPHGCYIAMARM